MLTTVGIKNVVLCVSLGTVLGCGTQNSAAGFSVSPEFLGASSKSSEVSSETSKTADSSADTSEATSNSSSDSEPEHQPVYAAPEPEPPVQTEAKVRAFITQYRGSLEVEIARGQGPAIETLSSLAGCDNATAVGAFLQARFVDIFGVVPDENGATTDPPQAPGAQQPLVRGQSTLAVATVIVQYLHFDLQCGDL